MRKEVNQTGNSQDYKRTGSSKFNQTFKKDILNNQIIISKSQSQNDFFTKQKLYTKKSDFNSTMILQEIQQFDHNYDSIDSINPKKLEMLKIQSTLCRSKKINPKISFELQLNMIDDLPINLSTNVWRMTSQSIYIAKQIYLNKVEKCGQDLKIICKNIGNLQGQKKKINLQKQPQVKQDVDEQLFIKENTKIFQIGKIGQNTLDHHLKKHQTNKLQSTFTPFIFTDVNDPCKHFCTRRLLNSQLQTVFINQKYEQQSLEKQQFFKIPQERWMSIIEQTSNKLLDENTDECFIQDFCEIYDYVQQNIINKKICITQPNYSNKIDDQISKQNVRECNNKYLRYQRQKGDSRYSTQDNELNLQTEIFQNDNQSFTKFKQYNHLKLNDKVHSIPTINIYQINNFNCSQSQQFNKKKIFENSKQTIKNPQEIRSIEQEQLIFYSHRKSHRSGTSLNEIGTKYKTQAKDSDGSKNPSKFKRRNIFSSNLSDSQKSIRIDFKQSQNIFQTSFFDENTVIRRGNNQNKMIQKMKKKTKQQGIYFIKNNINDYYLNLQLVQYDQYDEDYFANNQFKDYQQQDIYDSQSQNTSISIQSQSSFQDNSDILSDKFFKIHPTLVNVLHQTQNKSQQNQQNQQSQQSQQSQSQYEIVFDTQQLTPFFNTRQSIFKNSQLQQTFVSNKLSRASTRIRNLIKSELTLSQCIITVSECIQKTYITSFTKLYDMLNDKMPLKMVFAAILFIAYKNEKKLESIENNSDLILIDYQDK